MSTPAPEIRVRARRDETVTPTLAPEGRRLDSVTPSLAPDGRREATEPPGVDPETLTPLERALVTALGHQVETLDRRLGTIEHLLGRQLQEVQHLQRQAPGRALLAVVVMLWTSMLIVQLVSAAEHGVPVVEIVHAVRTLVHPTAPE